MMTLKTIVYILNAFFKCYLNVKLKTHTIFHSSKVSWVWFYNYYLTRFLSAVSLVYTKDKSSLLSLSSLLAITRQKKIPHDRFVPTETSGLKKITGKYSLFQIIKVWYGVDKNNLLHLFTQNCMIKYDIISFIWGLPFTYL